MFWAWTVNRDSTMVISHEIFFRSENKLSYFFKKKLSGNCGGSMWKIGKLCFVYLFIYYFLCGHALLKEIIWLIFSNLY